MPKKTKKAEQHPVVCWLWVNSLPFTTTASNHKKGTGPKSAPEADLFEDFSPFQRLCSTNVSCCNKVEFYKELYWYFMTMLLTSNTPLDQKNQVSAITKIKLMLIVFSCLRLGGLIQRGRNKHGLYLHRHVHLKNIWFSEDTVYQFSSSDNSSFLVFA